MYRRGLLARLAGLCGVGGLVAGAGCTRPARPSGPRTPPRSVEPTSRPESGLEVVDFTELEADDGDVDVRVVVENPTGEEQSGVVVAEVGTGGTETTVRREVTVAASERVEVTLETDLAYAEFAGGGSLSVRVE